jgi:rare lipoprotein A
VIVRVNDRGPFLHDRVIDLSYAAAYKLGIVGTGTGLVEVEAVEPEETTPVMVAGQPATPPPRHPGLEIISTAAADTRPPPPKLYLQVGAFTRSENAESLRSRLEQAAFKPVFVQPPALESEGRLPSEAKLFRGEASGHHNGQPPPSRPATTAEEAVATPLYRVRIGPLTGVEEGDRLGEQLRALGHSSTHIVVE